MKNLRELYQQVILDHNKNPRNYGIIDQADSSARGNNPLCGDSLDVYLKIVDGIIEDVKFVGEGCAIFKSSASMMTEALKGKTEKEAEELFSLFHETLVDKSNENIDELGKLAVLTGVKDYPVRVKCATLPWHTFNAALKSIDGDVSTE